MMVSLCEFHWLIKSNFDLDMAARILTKYRITRYPAEIARYKMLRHRPDTPNQSRFISFCFDKKQKKPSHGFYLDLKPWN